MICYGGSCWFNKFKNSGKNWKCYKISVEYNYWIIFRKFFNFKFFYGKFLLKFFNVFILFFDYVF